MVDMAATGADEDLDKVGFNLNTQKLHCLIVLSDRVAKAVSDRAGTAFFRAFIVENRKTGEVLCNYRFRYKHEDSWYRHELKESHPLATAPVSERVEYFADAMDKMLEISLSMLAGATVPVGVVTRFYPPEPDDSEKTMDWLIQQDLVEVKVVGGKPAGSEGQA